jgi:quercetin dioxygenase-like cupin family protein
MPTSAKITLVIRTGILWSLFVWNPQVPVFAQTARTVVDNDQVKVLSVEVAPHQKTRLHDHKVNRVMIYLQPGKQTIDYQDGKKTVLNWKAGEAKWSPASGMHVAEITSDQPVTIVEVELKNTGTSAKAGSQALDPLKVDPKHYKLEFENAQVRVFRVKLGPKETIPLHEHALNRVVTYLTEQKVEVKTPDGKKELSQHHAGDASWGGPAKHTEENLNDSLMEALVVELKG